MHQGQPTLADQCIGVGRHHIHHARLGNVALFEFLYLQGGLAAENLHHHAAITGRKVLQDDIGAGQIGRQVTDQLRQRLQPACRGADARDVGFAHVTRIHSIR